MVYHAKNKKQSKNHHIFLFIILALIICAAVIVALFFLKPLGNKATEENQETNSSSSEKKSESSETKKEEKKEESASTEPSPEAEKNNTQYEGGNPNNLEEITGTISFAGVSDGKFIVNASLDQTLGTSGACTFTLTHSSGTVLSGTVATEPGPSSSFCSFSTSSDKALEGDWKIVVELSANGKQGSIAQEVKI